MDPDSFGRYRKDSGAAERDRGASYGHALLAAIAGGPVEPSTEWNSISAVAEPNAELSEAYGALYGIYRDLYPATRIQTHALAELQRGENVAV